MLMRLPAIALLAVFSIADTAGACSIVKETRSLFEIRADSKAVAVDRECRTINAGVDDFLSLGPATSLGAGRVQQVLWGGDQSRVLVADCNTREVTILLGATTGTEETDCGPISTYADLAGENAIMSLSLGANLHELVALAAAKGVTEINPNELFFMFRNPWDGGLRPVGRKDRFDLLCGCKLYYPDLAGGKD